jgi:sec-independent protein translocase protein TatB
MFDVGWTELLLIAVVTLVVIGPKELPGVLRTIGAWVSRARAMAREFQAGIDELMRETELDDLRKKAQDALKLDPGHELQNMIDPDRRLESGFDFDRNDKPEQEAEPAAPPARPADTR